MPTVYLYVPLAVLVAWIASGNMILPLALGLVSFSSAASLYSTYTLDPLQHLGGVAPYFEPKDPPTNPHPPRGCTPVRAAYLVRHAARYANDFDYEEYLQPFINKWENHTGIDWSKIPSLHFLAKWVPPVTEAEEELLTRLGKLEATQLGVSLSFRYPDFRPPQRVWTSSAERTFESAKALVRAFEMDDNSINVVSIYESEEGGADTLTPYGSCPAYSSPAGSKQSAVYKERFTKPIMARLNALAPGFSFTSDDMYGMMELCGYESVIRGTSPFCDLDLFSPDDWLGWEYAADIQYHYNVGYGNDVAGIIGLPWLNATADLLMRAEGDAAVQDLYLSFTHRELPPTVLVAMGLFNNSGFGGSEVSINDTMPLHRINHRRAWKSSHVLPFLSNIAVERLNCTDSPGYEDGEYYRVLVNNAPQELPDCTDGPGTTCSRQGFTKYMNDRVSRFSGYSEKCAVAYENSSDVLTIYSDPKFGNGTTVGKRIESRHLRYG